MTTVERPPVPETVAPPSAGSRARTRARRHSPTKAPLRWQIITVALLTVLAIYFLLPVYWLTVATTKTTGDLFGSAGLWFHDPQPWVNLRNVVTYNDGIYLRWTANSMLYAGVGAGLATLLSAMAGYGIAKFDFRGRNAVFNLILAGVLIPGTALALPLFLLFSELNLANTYLAVLLPSVVSPFGVYLCRIYADTAIPDELIEAARIDGASEFRIFGTLGLRIMTPALVTVFLFQFVGIWNNYFLPLVMLNNPDLYPVTLGLTSWHSFADRRPELYQLTIGGAFLSVVPLMITIVALQRFWRGGLTQGSVKG